MKRLLLITIVLLSGCGQESEEIQYGIKGDDLTAFLAREEARQARRNSAWTGSAFMPGMTCGMLLMTSVLAVLIHHLKKQPYNGTIGRLDGWDGQSELVQNQSETKSKPSQLQNSFNLKEAKQ